MRAAEVRDGCPWPLSQNAVPAPACSPMGTTPPRRLAHRSRYPGAQDGVRDFSTRDLRPGPRAFASFRPKRPSLARAPRPSAASLAAGRAPSNCSQQRSTLPASSLTCTRDPCALSRACLCGQDAPSTWRTSASGIGGGQGSDVARQRERDPGLGCAHGPRPAIDRSMYHAMYGYKTNMT